MHFENVISLMDNVSEQPHAMTAAETNTDLIATCTCTEEEQDGSGYTKQVERE